jgi:hypothetical protein
MAAIAGHTNMGLVDSSHLIKLGVTGIFKGLQVRTIVGTLLLLRLVQQGNGRVNK